MITLVAKEGLLKATTPYNKEFVSFARMRGGKWSDGEKVWMFDPRDEFAVRSALIDIFGTDDYESCQKVTVQVYLDHFNTDREFILFGLTLLYRSESYSYVKMHPNVVVVSGGFPKEGGSRRHPKISPEPGTIIEVRDIPRDIAIRTWAKNKEGIRILGDAGIESLKTEKQALLERIAQIDKLLAELEAESERDELADLYDQFDEPPAEGS